MRKYLGVLAGVAALCVMSWAQAPAQVPAQAPAPSPAPIPLPTAISARLPQFPRFELFGGGSYAETGLFNAGHWAGLHGWDASLDLNASRWWGVIVEGGEYFGTSKIPTGTPEPFPNCPNVFCPGNSPTFNVATREYNFLFGVQFARRKYERWTPIGELMYGHQGTRGVATGNGATETEVGTGRAIVAGVGATAKSMSVSHCGSKPTISRPAPTLRLAARRSRTISASRWASLSTVCTKRSARLKRKLSPNRETHGSPLFALSD